MKIALPLTEQNTFSPHYGGSSKFAVYDVDTDQRIVRRQTIITPSRSEPCAWPPLLRAEGVSVILVGGMGRGAQQNMADNGVQVLLGVPPLDADTLIAAYINGDLNGGKNACDGHEGDHQHKGHQHEGGHCNCAH